MKLFEDKVALVTGSSKGMAKMRDTHLLKKLSNDQTYQT